MHQSSVPLNSHYRYVWSAAELQAKMRTTAAARGEVHSREGSCTSMENEAFVVSPDRAGSHDCAGYAALLGGADGREDSDTRCRPQPHVHHAGGSGGRDFRSGTETLSQ
jgi:hypothetical protein